jgi:glycosyl transferase family 25
MTWKIDQIPAQCISLKRRQDRWSNFVSQPGYKSFPKLERFDAVDGKTIDLKTDNRVLLSTKRNILNTQRRSHEELDSIGGVGCALSHIGIWQMMVQRQIPLLLVLEDDARLPADFVEKANALIASSKKLQDYQSWDMWVFSNVQLYSKPIQGEPAVHDLQAFVTTTCYVVSLAGATKLLADAFPIHAHIDHYMVILKQVRDMTYLSTPGLKIFQRGDKSDIVEKPRCLICDIPTDYHTTHSVVNKSDIKTLEAIKYMFVLSAAFGAGYILYKRFTGRPS